MEMLLALAVSSMIGLASFVLLDGVTRAEVGVAGKLDQFAQRDRMFRLLAMDAAAAMSAEMRDSSRLVLTTVSGPHVWHASDAGVVRQVSGEHGQQLRQNLSSERAQFESVGPGLLSLRLKGPDLWRLIALPERRSK